MLGYSMLSLDILNNLLPLADVIYGASLDAFQGHLNPRTQEFIMQDHIQANQLLQENTRNNERLRYPVNHIMIVTKFKIPTHLDVRPQVHGAVYEALTSMQSTIYIELNSTTDNPLVFPDSTGEQQVVSQGNFHGEILALCADRMSLSLFELGSISERRMDQLLDSSKSGLTPFLDRR